MVKYQDAARTPRSTACSRRSPIRHGARLLARLNEEDGVSVSELAEPFKMSLPAVMKHLDVLADAGLIARNKTGRTVACQLTAAPMEDAMHWLDPLPAFLDRATRSSRRVFGGRNMSASPKPLETAVKPSLTLKRRLNAPPAKVYAAWTDPAQLARWFGPADTVQAR